MNDNDRNLAAIIRLPTAWLVEFLNLPAGTVIEAAQMGFEDPGYLRLRIRGAGFPMIGPLIGAPAVEPMTHTRITEDGHRTVTAEWPGLKEQADG